jgi:hypothetical protein
MLTTITNYKVYSFHYNNNMFTPYYSALFFFEVEVLFVSVGEVGVVVGTALVVAQR